MALSDTLMLEGQVAQHAADDVLRAGLMNARRMIYPYTSPDQVKPHENPKGFIQAALATTVFFGYLAASGAVLAYGYKTELGGRVLKRVGRSIGCNL